MVQAETGLDLAQARSMGATVVIGSIWVDWLRLLALPDELLFARLDSSFAYYLVGFPF